MGTPRFFSARRRRARGKAAPSPAHPKHRADGGAARPAMSTIAPPPMSTPTRPARPLPASVPYLPHDDVDGGSSLGDPTASAVVALLDANLRALLRMDAGEFWRHIAHDPSVARALDTYLQHRRRPYDPTKTRASQRSAASEDEDLDDRLARRVFMTLRRLATIERDDPLAPTRAARARTLTELGLVRAPTVLDVCAIYGPDNPRATSALTRDLLRILGPSLEDDLAAVGAIAAVDLERRADALVEAAFAGDEAGGLGLGAPAGTAQLALEYFRDVASTIVELIRAVPALASRIDEGSRPSPAPRTSTFGEMTVVEEGGAEGVCRGGAFAEGAVTHRGALAAAADRIASETIPMIETSAEAFAAGTAGGGGEGAGGGAVAVACAAASSAMETLLRVMRDPPPPSSPEEDLADADGDYVVDDDDDVDASMAGKIESLRALFPDQYGDGYLALALDAFGGDPESAAGALLEGDLPAALRGIDPTLTPAAYSAMKMKTKTKRGAAGQTGPAPVAAPAALRGPWASRGGIEAQPASFPSDGATNVRGGFIRRKGDHRDRAGNRTWDLRTTADDRAATLARCAELEYDDEYDDSFDELAEVANVGSTAGEVSEGPPAGGPSGASGRSNANANARAGGQGQGASANKAYWIADGRVYHSKKEGATRIQAGGVEEAARLAAAQSAASRDEVHGLGAGGNRAAFDARAAPFTPGGGERGPGGGGRGEGVGGAKAGAGVGGGRGAGGRNNRGGGALEHQRKKHFRKDAAARKMSKGAGAPQ